MKNKRMRKYVNNGAYNVSTYFYKSKLYPFISMEDVLQFCDKNKCSISGTQENSDNTVTLLLTSEKKRVSVIKIIFIMLVLGTLIITGLGALGIGPFSFLHKEDKKALNLVGDRIEGDVTGGQPLAYKEDGTIDYSKIRFDYSGLYDLAIDKNHKYVTLSNLSSNQLYLKYLIYADGKDKPLYSMKDDEYMEPGTCINVDLYKLLGKGKHTVKVYPVTYALDTMRKLNNSYYQEITVEVKK